MVSSSSLHSQSPKIVMGVCLLLHWPEPLLLFSFLWDISVSQPGCACQLFSTDSASGRQKHIGSSILHSTKGMPEGTLRCYSRGGCGTKDQGCRLLSAPLWHPGLPSLDTFHSGPRKLSAKLTMIDRLHYIHGWSVWPFSSLTPCPPL